MPVAIEEFQKAVATFRNRKATFRKLVQDRQTDRRQLKDLQKDLQNYYRIEIKSKFIDGKIISLIEAALSGQDPKSIIVFAEAIAQGLSSYGVTTNTLRNIFGYAKKLDVSETGKQGEISNETRTKVYLMAPKIAYIEGRAESYSRDGVSLLKEVVETAVEKIGNDRTKFKNFMALFESIISYFRYYNPK